MKNLIIRNINANDFPEIWEILKQIIEEGNAFCSDETTTQEKAFSMWITNSAKAVLYNGKIIGAYNIFPLNWGRGSHVCDAALMIDKNNRQKGIGYHIAKSILIDAKIQGYKSIVFTSVVSTNIPAMTLWLKIGFKLIGTIPKAYCLKNKTLVDLNIMHFDLDNLESEN
ncbi:MAG: GNAT family N-acetyltransferase [Fibrobacteres bacterium]|nr:GNAT family N-acetyltransferase [Fibrobacterota bacterium]